MLNYEIEDPAIIAEYVAREIADFVRVKPNAVISPTTGSTPEAVYKNLISYRREGLDFSNTTWFGLDEYCPLGADSRLSYDYFLQTEVAKPLNVGKLYTLNGRERSFQQIQNDCGYYEMLIKKVGGIDLRLLGIGRNGHIGFNEPGSEGDSRTRLVTLDLVTRTDAVREFKRLENVPLYGITQGIGTIKEAKRILFIATNGEKVSPIMKDALMLPPTPRVPATLVRDHARITYYLSHSAAADWQRASLALRDQPPAGLRLL